MYKHVLGPTVLVGDLLICEVRCFGSLRHFKPYLVIYGQFPQLEEQIVPGNEPATDNYLAWDSKPNHSGNVHTCIKDPCVMLCDDLTLHN